MKTRPVIYTLGAFLFILGLTMLVPLGCSLLYGEGDSHAFVVSILITAGVGLALYVVGRPKGGKTLLGHREGFLIVSAGWVLASFFGGLPYMIHGALPNLTDAYFETMSGFTTTGATVINKIEALPHGILLWRSLTQWLGGMGIIILSIAILPFLGVGGRQLFRAEVPGPIKDKLEPRIAETARSLWIVYVIITIVGIHLPPLRGDGRLRRRQPHLLRDGNRGVLNEGLERRLLQQRLHRRSPDRLHAHRRDELHPPPPSPHG